MSTEVLSAEAATPDNQPESRSIPWIIPWTLLLVLTGLGAWLRFRQLELKPLHHDEGVNGWFIIRLLDEGKYNYNPKNYHGPLLYILNTIPVAIAGRTAEALRFMPALFGTLAIPAMVLFRRHIGWFGALVAAAWIALGPIEVYFSRTAIHEIYNFTFNMTLVGGVLAWATWRDRRYLMLASFSLAALFGTKETTIITVAAVVPALVAALWFGKDRPEALSLEAVRGWLKAKLEALSKPWRVAALVLFPVSLPLFFLWWLADLFEIDHKTRKATVLTFVVAWVVMFTFWLNPKGLGSFFEAFFRWGDTGTQGKGHEKPFPYFFTHLLWPYYRPMLLWGLPVMIWAAVRRDRFAIFTSIWFLLALAAYSIIPYKTPWCVLSFSSPLFLAMGVLADRSLKALLGGGWKAKSAGALGLAAGLLLLIPFGSPMPESFREALQPPRGTGRDFASQFKDFPMVIPRVIVPMPDSWTINFDEYDVKGHPFIYVQNVREYLDLINDIDGLIETAQLDGDEEKPRILMIDAKNPMRWYLNKTGTQTWRGKLDEAAKKKIPDEVDIICTSAQYTKDIQKLVGPGFKLRKYHERPGRKIDLFVREPLWKAYEDAAKKELARPISRAFQNRNYSDRRTAEMRDPWSRRGMN